MDWRGDRETPEDPTAPRPGLIKGSFHSFMALVAVAVLGSFGIVGYLLLNKYQELSAVRSIVEPPRLSPTDVWRTLPADDQKDSP
jgi:hypothetical protein